MYCVKILIKYLKFLFSLFPNVCYLHHRYKFKATEFDRRIIEKQGMFGVKKIPETARTSVKPFNFGIEARIDQRKQQKTETEV